jgi:magnesium chelatase family protein
MIQFSAPLHRHVEPELQTIDVWSAMAIPSFRVVGLPGQEIIESCERVRAAIEASGMEFPRKRVLVNLSPAGVRKQGTGTDLAIAIAVIHSSLAASSRGLSPRKKTDLPPPRLIVASAELALNGSVRSAGRVLRACRAAVSARASDLILAAEDSDTARRAIALIEQTRGESLALQVHLVATLEDVLPILEFPVQSRLSRPEGLQNRSDAPLDLLPLEPTLERDLAVACAGAHHLLLIGPKGTGKTASLQWLQSLQADLNPQELLDRLLLEELVQPGPPDFLQRAPIRIVPPQVRPESLVGGIHRGELRPGEFSQAHGGALIADEFLEWPRDSRECLRDPMESGRVQLTRSQQSVVLPARFQLAASANLCRCGGWPRAWSGSRDLLTSAPPAFCHCADSSRSEYLSRLSGPILDRIDIVRLVLQKPGVQPALVTSPERLREQTARCREQLIERWGTPSGRLSGAQVEEILRAEPAIERGWKQVRRPSETSLRRRHKEIRVALTLANWEQVRGIHRGPLPSRHHFEEASKCSADSWFHTLSRTELRRARPADSPVDPGPAAV